MFTVRPDQPPCKCGLGVQTQTDSVGVEAAVQETAGPDATVDEPAPSAAYSRSLVYVALLGTKAEASEASKSLLAQVNDDHAGLPHTLVFG